MTRAELSKPEARVWVAIQSIPKRAPWVGEDSTTWVNAPFVWSEMDPLTRPGVKTVLKHMRSLVRKGYLRSPRPMTFELIPEEETDG